MRKIILLLALSAFYAVCVRAANLTVGHLLCEYQDNPGAVDATQSIRSELALPMPSRVSPRWMK